MCALSVLQKECRKVWGARNRSENTVITCNSAPQLTPALVYNILWNEAVNASVTAL